MTTTIDKEQNYYFTNNTDIPNDHFDMDAIKEFLDNLGSPDYKDTHLTMVKGEAIVNSIQGNPQFTYKATYKWDPELEPLTQEAIPDIFDTQECLEEYLDFPDYRYKFEIPEESVLTLQVDILC